MNTNQNTVKIQKGPRLAYGEVDERRERNNKRHKPERLGKAWPPDRYDPDLNKKLAHRRRSLFIESQLLGD